LRVFRDDRKKGTRRRFWSAPSAFPVLDGVKAETEGIGESGLRHVQALADAFYINFRRHADLIAASLSRKELIDFRKSGL
jgi:hypothetical protein